MWQNPVNYTDPSGLDGGWAPSDLADSADAWLESWRSYLTGLDPHAVNRNTAINYAFNRYRGIPDLLRVGRGFGNYYYNNPCTIGADELFADVGRASGIALLLGGPAAGVMRAPGVRPTTLVSENVVYRGLAPGENPSQGLIARAPGVGNNVSSHVAGARSSQWISTTKSLNLAVTRYGQHGVVRINLAKVNGTVVDISKGIPGLPPNFMLSRWAINSQEVLILNRAPANAITVIR